MEYRVSLRLIETLAGLHKSEILMYLRILAESDVAKCDVLESVMGDTKNAYRTLRSLKNKGLVTEKKVGGRRVLSVSVMGDTKSDTGDTPSYTEGIRNKNTVSHSDTRKYTRVTRKYTKRILSNTSIQEIMSRETLQHKTNRLVAERDKILESFSGDALKTNLAMIDKEIAKHTRKLASAKNTGYRGSDYAPGGSREHTTPKNDAFRLVRYLLASVYTQRGIDIFIPKSNLGKYINRGNAVIERFGNRLIAETYVDWFVKNDNLLKTGYSLDLFVSSAMMNQFTASDVGKTTLEEDWSWLDE